MKQFLKCLILVVVVAGGLNFMADPHLQAENDAQRSPVIPAKKSGKVLAQVEPIKPAVPAAVPAKAAPLPSNQYMDYIFSHESSHNPYAVEPHTGACGLGQANPCSKLTSVCALSDEACQQTFFTQYAINRYGSWQAAYQFWLANHWW